MNKLVALLKNKDRKRFVELTASGPVLHQSNIEVVSVDTISTHEIDEATWNELMALLQTGELDNAKVKSVIKAKQ
jgi:hypothetical protein